MLQKNSRRGNLGRNTVMVSGQNFLYHFQQHSINFKIERLYVQNQLKLMAKPLCTSRPVVPARRARRPRPSQVGTKTVEGLISCTKSVHRKLKRQDGGRVEESRTSLTQRS